MHTQTITLFYRGELKSAQAKSTARKAIGPIRAQFHEQLKHFPDANINMGGLLVPELASMPNEPRVVRRYMSSQEKAPMSVGMQSFMPLFISCPMGNFPSLAIDVTMLTPATPHRIYSQEGDIDNRIKLLLDALRVPTESELNAETWPITDGETCWTLMEDDGFVRDLSVKQERIVGDPSSKDVLAIIRSRVIPA